MTPFWIGPYHPPSAGWQAGRWVFGQILPRIYWATQDVIGDYWRFGLETPPVGGEWVRYGADALLINLATEEVVQADYGVFG